jgi:hypothetical protein
MKNITSSTKTTIIFIAILVAGILFYFYSSGSPSDSSINSIDETMTIGDQQTQIAAAKILTLLGEMSMLRIDKTIFSDPLYALLSDHTVVIPTQNVGRTNPFAPYYTPARPASVAR